MLIFTAIGFIYSVCMGLRAPLILRESLDVYRLIRLPQGNLRVAWVIFRHMILPALLMAPATIVMEGRAAFASVSTQEKAGMAQYLQTHI